MNSLCPCGSNKTLASCCLPYIDNTRLPETPEQLMRSRYTAYTMANIAYIEKTMAQAAAMGFDPQEAKRWASEATWLGLTVLKTAFAKEEDELAYVQFFARFKSQQKKQTIYETSEFRKIDGKWFYTDGEHLPITKNQACPCGSGKKFKRCCGEDS